MTIRTRSTAGSADMMPTPMFTRRTLLAGATALLVGGGACAKGRSTEETLRAAIMACERASGGRLGVAMFDTGSSRHFAWRGDERFPLCSTFKLLLAAAILRRVDEGVETLTRSLAVTQADLVDYSPFTERQIGQSVPIADLCRATMTLSDNAAANLLLGTIGGPAGLTRFARELGDTATRLDRTETALGESTPGDPRDTTTPNAMLHDIERLLTGDVLAPPSRAMLTGWLTDNRTGAARLAAGLPRGWRIGDRTGGGDHGSTNDVGIIWPPARAPILIASYLTQTETSAETRNATHAKVARAVAEAFAR